MRYVYLKCMRNQYVSYNFLLLGQYDVNILKTYWSHAPVISIIIFQYIQKWILNWLSKLALLTSIFHERTHVINRNLLLDFFLFIFRWNTTIAYNNVFQESIRTHVFLEKRTHNDAHACKRIKTDITSQKDKHWAHAATLAI